MKILLVEEDLRFGIYLKHMLIRKGGYLVEWYTNRNEALGCTLVSHYDALILSGKMADENDEICQTLRKSGYMGVILVLKGKDSMDEQGKGIDAEVVEYLIEPFTFEKLLTTIRCLFQRTDDPVSDEVVQTKHLILNRTKRTLIKMDEEVLLTRREFNLLDLLIRNKGKVLSREMILDRIWGMQSEVSSNSVDVYIKMIRKKIDHPTEKTLIRNVRGVGYTIDH